MPRQRDMRIISHIAIATVATMLLAGCGADAAMKKGDKFYALGEYFDAAAMYKKAYSATPSKEREKRGERAKKLADCYDRINYTQKAVSAYKNVIRYERADSITHLRLAKQLMKNGSYKEAAENFQIAVDTLMDCRRRLSLLTGGDGNALVKRQIDAVDALIALAANGLRSAQEAPLMKEAGSLYTVKKEDMFNSRRADFSPMLAGDDNDQLYFTSTRNTTKGDDISGITGTKTGDIFVSQKDEKGKWTKPEDIDTELNTEDDEGACCFTPDFHTMYLTQCTTDPDYPRYATICTSQRADASWSKLTTLEITKDTLSSYAHPAVSPDGEWLYFTSDMPGGYGGYDIWRTRIVAGGFGAVENVGSLINTAGDEMFPTFRPNGDLYFSSDGHVGMGGLDIYIAKPDTTTHIVKALADQEQQDYTPWIIEHPGFPLNSQGDDFGMTFEGLLNRGFFSSNRGDGKGWDHIYSFVNPEVVQTVKGWVYEIDGYELPGALVYMVGNDGTNLKLSVRGDGSFVQQIKPDVDYVFLGTCKGFLNHKEELRVEPVEQSTEYVLQFPLASITAPVLIDNIFYDFDKATLRPESTTALDELVVLLNDNPNVTIELSAHCDYRGSAEYNKNLSQRRAESVVNYLVDHGIAADRLSPVGYGKEKPKTVRKKLAEQLKFLKEDDVLTEEFIKAIPDEEKQEICNQLNRRTEFMVLRTTYGMFDEQGNLKARYAVPAEPEEEESEEEEFVPDGDLFAPSEPDNSGEAPAFGDDLFGEDGTPAEETPLPDGDLFAPSEPDNSGEAPTIGDDLFGEGGTPALETPLPDDDLFAPSVPADDSEGGDDGTIVLPEDFY